MARAILMRHADASVAAPSDRARALSPEGRQDARRMGAWLREVGWVPDRVVVSPALRARQTAQEALLGLAGDAATLPLQVQEGLYSGNVGNYVVAVQEPECTLLVAHNPTIEEAVQALAGTMLAMPTASVACIEEGQLVLTMRPAHLP